MVLPSRGVAEARLHNAVCTMLLLLTYKCSTDSDCSVTSDQLRASESFSLGSALAAIAVMMPCHYCT